MTRELRSRREGNPVVRTTVEYGNRQVAGNKCGGGGYSYHYGPVVKVEATDADALTGWIDVTSEFLGSKDVRNHR